MAGTEESSGFETRIDRLIDRVLDSWVVLFVPSLVLLGALTGARSADPDLFARVAVGRIVATTGAAPRFDPFGFYPGRAWVDHEWLTGVIFHSLLRTVGEAGLLIAGWAAAVLTGILLTDAARRLARPSIFTVALSSLILLQLGYLWSSILRSQVVTYLLLAYLLNALVRWDRGRARLPLLAAAASLIPWANAHGGFVVGIAFLWFGLLPHLADRSAPERGFVSLVLLVTLATPFCTPYGVEYLRYLSHALTMSRSGISEWRPAGFASVEGAMMLGCGIPVLAGLVRDRRWGPTLMLVSGLYEGFSHVRLHAIPLMVVCVYGPPYFDAVAATVTRRSPILAGASRRVSFLLLAALSVLGFLRAILPGRLSPPLALDYSEYPRAAIDRLRDSGLEGKLLVDFNIGSFALWNLSPKFQVSMDGRYEEVYTDEEVARSAAAMDPSDPGWKNALDVLGADFALLRNSPRIVDPFIADGWRALHRDPVWVIVSSREGVELPAWRGARDVWTGK